MVYTSLPIASKRLFALSASWLLYSCNTKFGTRSIQQWQFSTWTAFPSSLPSLNRRFPSLKVSHIFSSLSTIVLRQMQKMVSWNHLAYTLLATSLAASFTAIRAFPPAIRCRMTPMTLLIAGNFVGWRKFVMAGNNTFGSMPPEDFRVFGGLMLLEIQYLLSAIVTFKYRSHFIHICFKTYTRLKYTNSWKQAGR